MDIVTITADRICIGDQIISKQAGKHWDSVTSRTICHGSGRVKVVLDSGKKLVLEPQAKLSVRRNQ